VSDRNASYVFLRSGLRWGLTDRQCTFITYQLDTSRKRCRLNDAVVESNDEPSEPSDDGIDDDLSDDGIDEDQEPMSEVRYTDGSEVSRTGDVAGMCLRPHAQVQY